MLFTYVHGKADDWFCITELFAVSTVCQRFNHPFFLFYLPHASWLKPIRNGFSCQVKVSEKCGGGTIRESHLYFFLLQDAPSRPSVLTGSGERPCAGHVDVNGAWRTSAAGTNFPTFLLPFSHLSSTSVISTWAEWSLLATVAVINLT